MSLAVEKLDGSMAKLTITVPAEEFTKAITSAYNKQKSKFSVPDSVREKYHRHSSRKCTVLLSFMKMLQISL